jgi:3-keto-L-gulonate-6-phosphate decarboxylase
MWVETTNKTKNNQANIIGQTHKQTNVQRQRQQQTANHAKQTQINKTNQWETKNSIKQNKRVTQNIFTHTNKDQQN